MDDLRARLANRVQLATDGHKAYLEAVEGAFLLSSDPRRQVASFEVAGSMAPVQGDLRTARDPLSPGQRRSYAGARRKRGGGDGRNGATAAQHRATAAVMRPSDLLVPRPEGLYCPPGDFYIDPLRPVARALITHAHSDHARAGHGSVLATQETLDLMAIRLGPDFCGSAQAADYGAPLAVGGVAVSFHPAGHVLGSAQIAVQHRGLRIVAAGDYKRQADPTCTGFEPIACDIFITEATFGLPVFHHPPPAAEIGRLLASLALFPNRAHLVGVYALGKAQRLIRLLRAAGYGAPIHIHGALVRLCDYYQERGVDLGPLESASERQGLGGAIVLGPPSAFTGPWIRRFADPLITFASGWMQVRARARQRGVELPLVLSDHCDWPELTATLGELAPSEVWVTHGREEALVRWCALNGLAARPLHLVGYEDEAE